MVARASIAGVVALAAAPVANAACPVHVSGERGAAPLRVVFRAACPSTSYRWDFGDGEAAVGRSVVHTYGGGRFRPALIADSSRVRLAPITSVALEIVAPRKADYGEAVTLHATVEPKLPVRLGGRTFRNGSLRLTVTRPLLIVVAGPAVVRRKIAVRPRLDVALKGHETIGSELRVVAVLRPAHAGSVRITVNGRPTDRVDTGNAGTAR